MIVVDVCLVVMALCLLVASWRVVVGPSDADRVLAVDLGFVVVVCSVALLAVRLATPAFLDLVLVATLVGFLATVVLARLVAGRAAGGSS
ncbi:monovalent cation/H+ antiporter complex subunit F [Pseudokineococcus sp. 1T1Z-3]|uniref:monovalent cation/H+ antiporter complex subunit F n=1 Tax=Pseudokineococcus sp. 1T1Z-3 TaxID=3132745 RepID=UPI00309D9271